MVRRKISVGGEAWQRSLEQMLNAPVLRHGSETWARIRAPAGSDQAAFAATAVQRARPAA
ncbi:hypothetical protein ACFQY5_04435 [Paeniroseomonas aquatica]|uniref:hypothetical protein n=1 Tax=Paeniroseomonas aquatica TaxID=373043 RepID=UPI00361ECE24